MQRTAAYFCTRREAEILFIFDSRPERYNTIRDQKILTLSWASIQITNLHRAVS